MKRPVTRELFAYWTALRRGRTAPHFEAVDPGAIRSHLPDVFVLSYAVVEGHPFRLAGTAVCALFGREMKGSRFASLWQAGQRPRLLQTLQNIAKDGAALVAGIGAETAEHDAIGLEMLLLPLTGDDGAPARLLGSLSPSSAPYWVGFRPLRELSLTSLRFVGPDDDAPRRPGAPLRGPGFVFYPASFSPIPRNYQD